MPLNLSEPGTFCAPTGEVGSEMFFIVKGSVSLSEAGGEEFEELQTGQFFGERSRAALESSALHA